MKYLVSIVALIVATTFAPLQAQSLDQLLEQVRTGSLEKSKAASELEAKFRSAGAGKTAMLADLRAQRAQLETRSETLEARFDASEEELNQLRTQRETSLGDLKELFGVIQQVVGESTASFETSIITAQFPERIAKFDAIAKKMSQSNELVTAAEIDTVWSEILIEMVEQGKVAKFDASIATVSGAKEQRAVVRAGVFNLLSDGKFLTHGVGGLVELPRQPAGRYLSQAANLQNASAGSTVEFSVDPTRGTLLGAAVESPSLMERVEQGGLVGYIILGVGAFAALIAIFKIIVLTGTASAVNRQAKNSSKPSSKNPLGRVLKVLKDNPSSDTEALELRLSEAIMKETPKLNSWLMFLKIVSVVAPLAGLLGTVLGMITTFQSITLFGAGDPRLMAGGISQALVTTVCGLVVAIPIVLLHTAAASKAKRVEEVLEEQSAGMVARQIEK